MAWHKDHREKIIRCSRCPRLRRHCQEVARNKRRAYQDETYWGKPLPSFGDYRQGRALIVGLAPAAHGANRTGRMFTGDRSGEWLYRALYKAGLGSRATSEHSNDGLTLDSVLVSAVVRCAPPQNKPTPDEILRCGQFLKKEIEQLRPRVYLALGQIAYNGLWKLLAPPGKKPKFAHGKVIRQGGTTIVLSYHPSQQNTFTKRLTEPMFNDVFAKLKQALA